MTAFASQQREEEQSSETSKLVEIVSPASLSLDEQFDSIRAEMVKLWKTIERADTADGSNNK